MKNWSPALYRREGKKQGIPQKVIENSIIVIERLLARKMPIILTLKHLSNHTKVPLPVIKAIISNPHVHYVNFSIKKRSGGYRVISAPDINLEKIQKWINTNILQIDDNNSIYSYAYKKGTSIADCAKPHCNCKWLIKIDIKNYFETISEIDVYNYFHNLGYTKLLSFQLARLCTINYSDKHEEYLQHNNYKWKVHNQKKYKIYSQKSIGHLPQGAPTSPMLANLITIDLDQKIDNFLSVQNFDLIYTRYADDIYISTESPAINKEIVNKIINGVYRLLEENGFTPNAKKTQISHPGTRKIILGLLVNSEKLHLPKDFKAKLECHLYYYTKNRNEYTEKRKFNTIFGLTNYITGLLAFARQIEPEYIDKISKKYKITKETFII